MKIYLAGGASYQWEKKNAVDELRRAGRISEVNVLDTFYERYLKKPPLQIENYNLLLDSGAFSFLSSGKRVDWDEYITRYIEYINANDVKLFFELDIDKIVGYDRVKEIRRRLERETGKRPIPVWHKHLGKAEFLRMCDEFDYIAIGGLAIGNIKITEYKYLPAFIREAHKRGAKVHGLGLTHSAWLPKLHFDSVDSTSWVVGTKYGQIYTFTGKSIQYKKRPAGTRVKPQACAMHNFTEWVKFSNWAETHL